MHTKKDEGYKIRENELVNSVYSKSEYYSSFFVLKYAILHAHIAEISEVWHMQLVAVTLGNFGNSTLCHIQVKQQVAECHQCYFRKSDNYMLCHMQVPTAGGRMSPALI
jgi:hypothetical protein